MSTRRRLLRQRPQEAANPVSLGKMIPGDIAPRETSFRFTKRSANKIKTKLDKLEGREVIISGGGGPGFVALGIVEGVTLESPITKGEADALLQRRPDFSPQALRNARTKWTVKASIRITKSVVGFLKTGETWTPTLASWQVQEVIRTKEAQPCP